MGRRVSGRSHRIETLKHRKSVRQATARRLPVSPQQLLSLVAAADLDALIEAAFGALGAAVRCDCVSVFYTSVGDRMLLERDSTGRKYGAEFTALHARLTPAIPIAMANPGIRLLPTRTGLPQDDAELHDSAFYREVMQVQGWRHAVALCFWDRPPAEFPVLVFSVKRKEGRPDFSDQDLADLETMHAFMEPAIGRIRERTAATSVYDAIATPLRHDARGVVVLDSRFQVVRSNLVGQRLLRRGLPPAARSGRRERRRIRIPPAVLDACRALNAERLQRRRSGLSAEVLRRRLQVPVAERSALDVLITMISHDDKGIAEPSCVVEIDERLGFDGGEGVASAVGLAGMTAAERQVATALADGLSNQEIADRLGKTVYAVKFLLHQIYRKTGIANRAGLVARLRSGSQRAPAVERQRVPSRRR
jgi:DNA-binding CsgD family transcriptional regulator